MYCQDYYSFLISILVQFIPGKACCPRDSNSLVQQKEPQPNRCQYLLITYLELEEEEDVVDGQVIATKNNCQLESSALESPQPGCLDTSTLRLLDN